MIQLKRVFLAVFWLLMIAFCCASCVNTRGVTYFNNISDTMLQAMHPDLDPVIQSGDILSISVSSITPEVAVVFNTPNSPATNSPISESAVRERGYLVNQDGYIQYPVLGNLQVAGLRKTQLKEELTHRLKEQKLLFDPIVTIRYLNFHVTILGEVNHPGLLTVQGEQITLLEALGMAGDLTIYGKRENVLLLRNENKKRIVRRLDLRSPKVLSSPYFYLKSNDVIYVEPNKNKVASVSQSRQLLPSILSGLSFLVIVLDRVVK